MDKVNNRKLIKLVYLILQKVIQVFPVAEEMKAKLKAKYTAIESKRAEEEVELVLLII